MRLLTLQNDRFAVFAIFPRQSSICQAASPSGLANTLLDCFVISFATHSPNAKSKHLPTRSTYFPASDYPRHGIYQKINQLNDFQTSSSFNASTPAGRRPHQQVALQKKRLADLFTFSAASYLITAQNVRCFP